MNSSRAAAPSSAAALLAEIAILLELTGGDSFRARAFASAGRALEGSAADLEALAHEGRLTTLRGVGPGIATVLEEIVQTGHSSLLEELRAQAPAALYDLLRIPGLGPKRIHLLHRELGIDGLEALEEAARSGAIAQLPGFGPKTQAKILEGLAFARANRQLRRYPEALEIAVRLLEWARGLPAVRAVEIAGALRRRCEVIERIDLVVATSDPEEVLAAFGGLQGSSRAAAASDEAVLELADGMLARLRCVPPADFVATVLWETGSGEHLQELARIAEERGELLDRGGVHRDGRTLHFERESEIYEQLGLSFVPPELREGMGELELARAHALPVLIEEHDLRGTFHCHTTASDGRASLREMAEAARERGWSYLGISDHSRTAAYARGLSIEAVEEQQAEIADYNRALGTVPPPFRLLHGIESDILPDGSLDYPDEVLSDFDFVIGSVHSSFRMPRAEMTARIVRAVQNPALTILGHATGRLLLTRGGYEVDLEAVLEAAAASGVVVEINADPHRLDLDWRSVRRAAELGILIAINPDAHSRAALDNVRFGIQMARKAGLEARQVLNSWPLEEVLAYLGKRKQAFPA